jgi:hypothetical protein
MQQMFALECWTRQQVDARAQSERRWALAARRVSSFRSFAQLEPDKPQTTISLFGRSEHFQ